MQNAAPSLNFQKRLLFTIAAALILAALQAQIGTKTGSKLGSSPASQAVVSVSR